MPAPADHSPCLAASAPLPGLSGRFPLLCPDRPRALAVCSTHLYPPPTADGDSPVLQPWPPSAVAIPAPGFASSAWDPSPWRTPLPGIAAGPHTIDRKSTRLNSSHLRI